MGDQYSCKRSACDHDAENSHIELALALQKKHRLERRQIMDRFYSIIQQIYSLQADGGQLIKQYERLQFLNEKFFEHTVSTCLESTGEHATKSLDMKETARRKRCLDEETYRTMCEYEVLDAKRWKELGLDHASTNRSSKGPEKQPTTTIGNSSNQSPFFGSARTAFTLDKKNAGIPLCE